jgi:hypothetical protein
MNPEFLQVVRDNLHSLGYQNLSDSLVEEFARRLQDEGTHITIAEAFQAPAAQAAHFHFPRS